MRRESLARTAMKAALELRRGRGSLSHGFCPFDLASDLGIVVRSLSLPSLEGVYLPRETPLIVLSCLRPSGRMRFTCAHEIGHHVFGHGTCIDELRKEDAPSFDPNEFAADRFAATLLMPKLAVDSAFARRGWSIPHSDPVQIFTIAQSLGVGYETLVGHLEWTLKSLPSSTANILRRRAPKAIREEIAGFPVTGDVFAVDHHWLGRSIDAEIGDLIFLPDNMTPATVGRCLEAKSKPRPHLLAVEQGVTSLVCGSWSALVRVSRPEFVGLAKYRYLEDLGDA